MHQKENLKAIVLLENSNISILYIQFYIYYKKIKIAND